MLLKFLTLNVVLAGPVDAGTACTLSLLRVKFLFQDARQSGVCGTFSFREPGPALQACLDSTYAFSSHPLRSLFTPTSHLPLRFCQVPCSLASCEPLSSHPPFSPLSSSRITGEISRGAQTTIGILPQAHWHCVTLYARNFTVT